MVGLFFKKRGNGESRLCRSCYLLEHGEEPPTFPAANGKKQASEMTFVDVDRCSSCNPGGGGPAYSEISARRQFWYAGVDGNENGGEGEEEEDERVQGKKRKGGVSSSSSSSSIASLIKGFGKLKVNRNAASADEDEDEGDGDDGDGDGDMPPPPPLRLRRQVAFKLVLNDDGAEVGDIPSVFVIHHHDDDGEDGEERAHSTPLISRAGGPWVLSEDIPSIFVHDCDHDGGEGGEEAEPEPEHNPVNRTGAYPTTPPPSPTPSPGCLLPSSAW